MSKQVIHSSTPRIILPGDEDEGLVRLAWATDVHFDISGRERMGEFIESFNRSKAERLIITGDIGTADTLPEILYDLNLLARKPIHIVLGNHDYWLSSISYTIAKVDEVCAGFENVHFHHSGDTLELTPYAGIVFLNNFYDGTIGSQENRFEMQDFRVITDFMGLDEWSRRRRLVELGRRDVEAFRSSRIAQAPWTLIILACHVPPFKDAALYNHRPSPEHSLPFYTAGQLGEELITTFLPRKQLTVLCGHTHSAADVRVLSNLRCVVGGANYGYPELQPEIFVSESGVRVASRVYS